MDAHEDYQVNVFNVVMDQIVTSTNSRFENHFTKIFPVWTLANLMNVEDRGCLKMHQGLIPRALFLGEMRIISPVSFELRLE
jgi:hypothetical protein